eukprot:TRINITY_DN6724_c1_g1_i3.p1 TRINITY_DN6724_c1_g1~~TRINITY_DN6724_c1_g1_i3.p1  ORF type:complete len:455 (+),score=122.07 TRINITY_DN6724_c1_g1_i3:486-1850(+)
MHFLQMRYLLTLRNLLIVAAGFLLIWCVPFETILIIYRSYATLYISNTTCLRVFSVLNNFYIAYLVLVMALCTLMGFRMTTLEENFRLTGEFKYIALIFVYIIFFLLLQTNSNIRNIFFNEVMIEPWLVSFVPSILFHMATLYRPSYYASKEELLNDFSNQATTLKDSTVTQGLENTGKIILDQADPNKHAREAVKSTRDYRAEFEKVLDSKEGTDIFKKFLVKEFAVENLLFYLSVRKFKQCFADESDDSVVRMHARRIYNEYVSLTATWSVNISSECKRRIEKNLRVRSQADAAFSSSIILDQKVSIREMTFKNLNETEKAASSNAIEVESSYSTKANALPSLDSKESEKKNQSRVNLFDEAQQEIFLLMLKDSFRRFYQDPEYKALKIKLDKIQVVESNGDADSAPAPAPAPTPLSPEALLLAKGLPPNHGVPLKSVGDTELQTIPDDDEE